MFAIIPLRLTAMIIVIIPTTKTTKLGQLSLEKLSGKFLIICLLNAKWIKINIFSHFYIMNKEYLKSSIKKNERYQKKQKK